MGVLILLIFTIFVGIIFLLVIEEEEKVTPKFNAWDKVKFDNQICVVLGVATCHSGITYNLFSLHTAKNYYLIEEKLIDEFKERSNHGVNQGT